MTENAFLTKKEVIAYLKISLSYLDQLMRDKEIPYHKLKRKVLFKKSDIDRFMESKRVK